jgi:uncharacterized protein (TIGR03000 family)
MRHDIRRLVRRAAWLWLLALALPPGPARADDKKDDKAEERVEAARAASDKATLFRREAPGKPWQIVDDKETLSTGDLLLGGGGGALVSKNGAVHLALVGDFSENKKYPIYETALVLNPADDVDLDVSLNRGRIDLVNQKDKGAARVRVRLGPKSGVLTLAAPGDRAAVELYGRWLRGTPFEKEAKPGVGPALAAFVLALKGDIDLKGSGGREFTLKAPALLQAEDLNSEAPLDVEKLDKLPEWAEPDPSSERFKRIQAVLGRFRKLAVDKGIGEALDTMAASDDSNDRRSAVVLMGAFDDLERLGKNLRAAKHQDVFDQTVVAMRHWIGRGPGQDQKLYQGLIDRAGYQPKQAESVLQMLHGFNDEEIAQPELYESLIDYLECDKPALRVLAYWHLVRLAPVGKDIAYDPNGSKEEIEAAAKAWRKLIPAGKLPPKTKPDDKEPARDANEAEITLIVPPDAEVFFNGKPSTEKGKERVYTTPPLDAAKRHYYEVRVRWTEDGKAVERTRRIDVAPGARVKVDFTAPEK